MNLLDCRQFDAGRCRSCTLLETPYATQLVDKQQEAAVLLAGHPDLAWLPPVPSALEGFRNKAKMVVTGTAAQPTLGILRPDGTGVDQDGVHALVEPASVVHGGEPQPHPCHRPMVTRP